MEQLLGLPGVGRKTANFVLGMVYGIPSICVDVHVHRVSNRLGLVRTNSPEETELALQRIYPKDEWTGINHTMVRFGQRICRPVRPLCDTCPFSGECPSSASEEA
jgi:endonuclease-3